MAPVAQRGAGNEAAEKNGRVFGRHGMFVGGNSNSGCVVEKMVKIKLAQTGALVGYFTGALVT